MGALENPTTYMQFKEHFWKFSSTDESIRLHLEAYSTTQQSPTSSVTAHSLKILSKTILGALTYFP